MKPRIRGYDETDSSGNLMSVMRSEKSKDIDTLSLIQVKTRRRQQVARHVYNVWTLSSSDLAGLASPIFCGQFDALSSYVVEYYEYDIPASNVSHSPLSPAEDGRFCEHDIDQVYANDLTYEDFCQKYMYQNRPVIIRGLANSWPCLKNWTEMDHTGHIVPNISYLNEHFGGDVVSIHGQLNHGFCASQQRPDASKSYEMTIREYVQWWTQFSNESSDQSLFYLKDWRFASLHPKYNAYTCPSFFHDDWLNEAKNGTYRFVYMGPKGTVTALHADVLRSFSWSTNICGRKRWCFVPPLYSHLLYDCFGAKLAYHLFVDLLSEKGDTSSNFLSALFPGLQFARRFTKTITQEAGDTIFVPSNWFHTVENIADTLSINHNWLNGSNLRQCWFYVDSEVRSSTAFESTEFSTTEDLFSASSSTVKMDDAVLNLWHIVGTKAYSFSQMRFTVARSTACKIDLEAILFVIDGLLALESDGFVSLSALNSVYDIISLRCEIMELLTTLFMDQ